MQARLSAQSAFAVHDSPSAPTARRAACCSSLEQAVASTQPVITISKLPTWTERIISRLPRSRTGALLGRRARLVFAEIRGHASQSEGSRHLQTFYAASDAARMCATKSQAPCASPSSTRRPGRSRPGASRRTRTATGPPRRVPRGRSRRRLLPDAVRALLARRAGDSRRAPGQGPQPLGLRVDAGRGGRAALDADLFGMSCWTANRRGVGALARKPSASTTRTRTSSSAARTRRRSRPRCSRTTPRSTPSRSARASSRSSSSSSASKQGARRAGIAGTVYRADGQIERGPERDAIRRPRHARVAARLLRHAHPDDVARLPVGVHVLRRRDHVGPRLSRALGAATCSTRWSRRSSRLPVKMIQIKDDTFTTNKKRVLELCRGIRERKLDFFWSCDTRVDVLDRGAPPRDAPRRLPAAQPRRRVGLADDPGQDRQEDHGRRDHRVDASSPRSTASRSATT